jgi:hypothetical protein
LPEIASGQDEFLGARPALDLLFALEGQTAVGKGLGVKQFKGWAIRSGLAAGPAAVLRQAPVQIASGSDIKMAVLEAKDVNEVRHLVTLKVELLPFDSPLVGLP